MIDIKINITNKIANAIGTPFIVCGNSDYTVTFTFDAEWGAYQEKTARFFFVSDGIEQYIDVLFSGNTCNAPVLPNIEKVLIGVYTGNLRTTTGAEVRCKRSILFGGKVHEPPTNEDVYNEILEIVGKKLGSEGGTVTGDYFKDGNTFIHEGNLDLLDETDNLAITKTATGSAITIESAKAPLQQLKLFGKTEQNGIPTPDNPIELKSVGDSGSFMVGVYGRNLLEVNNTTQTKNGVTFTNNGDGSVTVSGTATAETTYLLNSNASIKLPKGKYKMSGDHWFIYLKLDNKIQNTYSSYNSDVFEIGDGNYTFQAHIWVAGNSTVNFTCNPMILLLDETDTTFVKGETPQTLTFTDTLRGIGDIADEKDLARGVTTQRFGIVDLGTLNWVVTGSRFQAQPLNAKRVDVWSLANLLCSHYFVDYAQNTWSEGNDKRISINQGGYIHIVDKDYTDVTAFKTAMSGVYLVYEFAEPIETPLTETELNAYRQLMTNKGTTTVLSECEDTEITYYINKPNAQAIGNIHSQMNKDYLKLQQAIIETGGN